MQTAKRVWSVLTTILVVLVVAVALLLVGLRIFGLRTFSVLSGSMEPTYHTGSLIFVQPKEAQEIKVGDPISFVMNDDLVVATHRVTKVETDSEGVIFFTTKGDANRFEDGSPVHEANLIGKAVFSIPLLGYVVSYVRTPPGTYVAVAAGALLILILFIPELVKAFRKERNPEESAGSSK